MDRDDLGFLFAKATQRWNELLQERFRDAGWDEVRPSYGSILVPLFEEDGLRMGELARRSRLSKQTMTTMVRLLERDGLVRRQHDPEDGRATRIVLTARARRFEPIAQRTLDELGALALERLGKQRLATVKRALKEWIEHEAPHGHRDLRRPSGRGLRLPSRHRRSCLNGQRSLPAS